MTVIVATPEERMELARQAAALLYANGVRNVWVFGFVARGKL